MEDIHNQFITYQLLKTMHYMHSGQLLDNITDAQPDDVIDEAVSNAISQDPGLSREDTVIIAEQQAFTATCKVDRDKFMLPEPCDATTPPGKRRALDPKDTNTPNSSTV